MTSQEQLMYQILGKLFETNAPIVFKGALITKLVLNESGYKDIERMTKDIDGDWVGTPPTMEQLVETINQSLIDFQGELYAVAGREYLNEQTAGINILDKETNEKVISMDIGIRPVRGNRTYYYGTAKIKGVLPNDILSDKIAVLSSKTVFRRAKDIVDVYALSHCVKISIFEILNACKEKDIEIGLFDEFYLRKADIKHAYDKLRGVERKPDFEIVYSHLSEFLRPFAERNMSDCVWDNINKKWGNKTKKRVNNYLL
ncbi:MAG: nucleotidyl transferase AbiEii/AbiGii toxin family protein [Defluviitaleaceae bacterium]|nr:nucleotidyl transferase AbiEii/AbiGii toxin family protein [Defluviitaleaceae bacterium]